MRLSTFTPTVGLFVSILIGLPGTASAQRDPEITVGKSLQVLSEITRNPKTGMPRMVMKNAHGIAIIPEMFKMSFIFGARFGRGVLVVRQPDGSWSNPLFVQLAGGSFGAQAGAQSTDLVLVFQSQRGLDRFLKGKGKLTIGVDVGAAAGPVGKRFEASTDAGLKSEILSYSNSHGIFAGVSAEGGTLQIDGRANAMYYQQPVSPLAILSPGSLATIPASTVALQQMLAEKTALTERVVRANPRSESVIVNDASDRSLFGESNELQVEGAIREDDLIEDRPRVSRTPSTRPARPRVESSTPDELDAIPSSGTRNRNVQPERSRGTNEEDLPETIPPQASSKPKTRKVPALPPTSDDDAPALEAPDSDPRR